MNGPLSSVRIWGRTFMILPRLRKRSQRRRAERLVASPGRGRPNKGGTRQIWGAKYEKSSRIATKSATDFGAGGKSRGKRLPEEEGSCLPAAEHAVNLSRSCPRNAH